MSKKEKIMLVSSFSHPIRQTTSRAKHLRAMEPVDYTYKQLVRMKQKFHETGKCTSAFLALVFAVLPL
jgi:hypothetical protein